MDENARAQRFEEEKARIIESCFLRQEPDGAYAESYITHIPVIEDASSPSTPPPPSSNPSNKKPRVIIVAVRRSGRVRLHKARENGNKTFSIGKTWQLDDLSAIESFTGPVSSSEDQQRATWAGSTGMLINIQKPYFWQAASQKEKDFFIRSLVKIYRKYTGGQEPRLTGFTSQELALCSPSARPKTPQSNSTSRASPMPPSPAIRPPPSLSSSPAPSATLPPREPAPREPISRESTPNRTTAKTSTPNRIPARDYVQRDLDPRDIAPRDAPKDPVRSPERQRASSRNDVRIPMRSPSRAEAPRFARPEPEPEPEPSETAMPPPEILPERRRPPVESTMSTGSAMTTGSGATNYSQNTEQPSDPTDEPAITVASPTDSAPISPSDSFHRPGLGPMIKKKSGKDIAGKFRQAAAAANAFKPRAGGAGERLMNEASKPAGPAADGINGVFYQPKSPMPPTPSTASFNPTPDLEKQQEDIISKSNASVLSKATPPPEEPAKVSPKAATKIEPLKATLPVVEEKKKRPTTNYAKYAKALGIDPSVLEGRTAETEAILEEFGWGEDTKKVSHDDLQTGMRRDLAKVETGSWLGSLEAGDDRVSQVAKLLDKAIAECDEMDSLLTLYKVELETLHEDVAYIEAQEQGLQVQTANQRLLFTELRNLESTISLSSSQLRPLREASLSRPEGIEDIEASLAQLYKAMLTIDPDSKLGGRLPSSEQDKKEETTINGIGSEVSGMRAVQDKKQGYQNESDGFVLRFRDHMEKKFREGESLTRDAFNRPMPTGPDSKLDQRIRDDARQVLWIYSPIMLYTRELASSQWEAIISMYMRSVQDVYKIQCRDNVNNWKAEAKTPSGEHEDVLFTQQEKENEGGGLGRRLTVRRTKKKVQDGKITGYEAFAGTLFDTSNVISAEQNFISRMFHVSSQDISEFSDLIALSPPVICKGADLSKLRNFDPDRKLAKQLKTVMSDTFRFWADDISKFVDWITSQDPLQGVGILFALESRISVLEESDQEYIVHTLQAIQSRLVSRFDRFADEQIRGIEDTKVKIKKRKGLISFIKIYPYFIAAVEQMLPPHATPLPVHERVNAVYGRINRSMFDSLKFIAKESPMVMAGQKSASQAAGGDADDKEILNYHILLIQNMHHYAEEVQPHKNAELEAWKQKAEEELAEHMNSYVAAVIRRPLGKLIDAIESVEALLAASSSADQAATAVAQKPSHSKATFGKLLSDYDAKDVRHKIDSLKKRVEKHFGEADDPDLSRKLVGKVLKECEERYVDVLIRTNRIVRDVYEGALEVDFKRNDITGSFRGA